MANQNMSASIDELRELMYRGKRSGINSGAALIVWGLLSLLMIETTPRFFYPHGIGEGWQPTLYATLFLIVVVTAGLFIDFKLTAKTIVKLDGAFDYTWKQVSRIWVIMPLLGIFFTALLGTSDLGFTLFGVWTIFIGVGFYFSGLFSLKLYEYYGLLLIVSGIAFVFIPIEYTFTWTKLACEIILSGGMVALGIYVKRRYGW